MTIVVVVVVVAGVEEAFSSSTADDGTTSPAAKSVLAGELKLLSLRMINRSPTIKVLLNPSPFKALISAVLVS